MENIFLFIALPEWLDISASYRFTLRFSASCRHRKDDNIATDVSQPPPFCSPSHVAGLVLSPLVSQFRLG
jgi:hypothetical protein